MGVERPLRAFWGGGHHADLLRGVGPPALSLRLQGADDDELLAIKELAGDVDQESLVRLAVHVERFLAEIDGAAPEEARKSAGRKSESKYRSVPLKKSCERPWRVSETLVSARRSEDSTYWVCAGWTRALSGNGYLHVDLRHSTESEGWRPYTRIGHRATDLDRVLPAPISLRGDPHDAPKWGPDQTPGTCQFGSKA